MPKKDIHFIELLDEKEEEITIKKKIIRIESYQILSDGKIHKDRMFKFPILYSIDKKGKERKKEMFVVGSIYYRSYGTSDGKMQLAQKVGEEKDIGKKNETTKHQNALSVCAMQWLKATENDYSMKDTDLEPEDIVEDESRIIEQKLIPFGRSSRVNVGDIKFNINIVKYFEPIKPMLAKKFKDREKHITCPVGTCKKYDGARGCAYIHMEFEKDLYREGKKENKSDKVYVTIATRTKKPLGNMIEQRKQVLQLLDIYGDLTLILDFEIYSHDIKFRKIVGSIRKSKGVGEHDHLLDFYIFDIVNLKDKSGEKMKYSERIEIMKKMEKIATEEKLNHVKFCFPKIANSMKEIDELHDEYVKEGYEGIMIRDMDAFYEEKYRSNSLLKHKNFEEKEFEIVECEEATGSEKGAIMYTCRMSKKDKRTFTCRLEGSIKYRRELWKQYKKNPEDFIGKMLTVKYQDTDGDEEALPKFLTGKIKPTAKEIRDYE